MDVRSYNVTPVSQFVKAELDKIFFFQIFMCFTVKKKIFFKHYEQKGLIKM